MVGGPYIGHGQRRPTPDATPPPSSRAPGAPSTSGSSTPSTTGTSTRRAPTSSSSTAPATPTTTNCCRTSSRPPTSSPRSSEWVRQQTRDLPLWWAECYVEPADSRDDREGWSETRRDRRAGRRNDRAGQGRRHVRLLLEPGEREGHGLRGLSVDADQRQRRRSEAAHVRPGQPLRQGLPAGDARTRTSPSPPDDVPNVRVLADRQDRSGGQHPGPADRARRSTGRGSTWRRTR